MSKEAMKLALEAQERAWLWMENQADGQSKGGHATFDLMMLREERNALRDSITAIREALAEQKSGIKQVIELYDSPDQPAQQKPVANYCKECLTYNGHHEGCSHHTSPPAQQEPVAWMEEMPTQEGETRSVRMTTLKEHATLQWGNPIPLYTSPPAQRTWVGLDNDDLVWIYSNSDNAGQAISNTEAKLKEKNT